MYFELIHSVWLRRSPNTPLGGVVAPFCVTETKGAGRFDICYAVFLAPL